MLLGVKGAWPSWFYRDYLLLVLFSVRCPVFHPSVFTATLRKLFKSNVGLWIFLCQPVLFQLVTEHTISLLCA